MARPGQTPPTHPYSLRLQPAIWLALRARAKADRQTMTEVIMTALRGHLGVRAQPSDESPR